MYILQQFLLLSVLFTENLKVHPSPTDISHNMVGKYFKSFDETHYVMNHALEKYYPDDLILVIDNAKRYRSGSTGVVSL